MAKRWDIGLSAADGSPLEGLDRHPPALPCVGVATRLRVGRWVPIEEALAELEPAEREGDGAHLLEVAIASGLVEINPGTVAHSIKLTEAGLAACHSVAERRGS